MHWDIEEINERCWNMKILVYGAGVLGCNLARNFYHSGKDVTLLARGNWGEEIQKNGLCIKDIFSPFHSISHIPVITELKQKDAYDVIFVTVRYTQLQTIFDTLQTNVSKNIVFVGNNVRALEIASYLPGKNCMFAFTSSAGHRETNRVVSVDLKKITIGPVLNTSSNQKLIQQIFCNTKYKVFYEKNMNDYLLCHAAFVLPVAFACYKVDGNLKRLKGNTTYLNKMIDANIEGYRAIQNSGHEILPKEDKDFESPAYRKTCLRFFELMCATRLGKICASDHAMHAVEEMLALNTDLKKFYDKHSAPYPVWKELEKDSVKYC